MARRGFKIADAYVDVHANKDGLREDIRTIGDGVDTDADAAGKRVGQKLGEGAKTELDKAGPDAGKRFGDGIEKGADPVNRGRTTGRNYAKGLLPEADTGGRAYGDKLSQGMNLAIVRNSPLIVAGIGAVLAAGAPAVLAASTILFAGVGVALASQNDQVQAAWAGLWDDIRNGTTEDASQLSGTVEAMAGRVGVAFQNLRPQFQDIFGNSKPLVTGLVDAVVLFANNAMPGFVRAVAAGQPVMDGFKAFLGSVGTGLTAFFDALTAHAPSAGAVFAQLGNVIGTLLPVLGELIGQGTELARGMLPLLSGSLSVVLDLLRFLGPALPLVASGFLGFKAASAASGYLRTFAQDLAFASYSTSPFAGAMGKASSAVSGLATALPVIGTVLAIGMAAFEAYNRTVDDWASALLQGGAAARTAQEQMAGLGRMVESMNPAARAAADAFGAAAAANLLGGQAADQARQKYESQLAAMDPLTRAQTLQKQALNDLNDAIGKNGAGSAEAERAAALYAARSADVERAQRLEEIAIRGVTKAMIEQADQADARANSDLGYRQSVLQTKEAIDALHKAQDTQAAGSHELESAYNDVEAAMIRQVEAANRLAQDALPSTTDKQQKAALGAQAALQEFDKLAQELGGPLPENLQRYRDDLARAAGQMDTSRVGADVLRNSLAQVGLTVATIPGTKDVKITAPTEGVIKGLEELGFTVIRIPGSKDVTVSASTDAAQRNLGEIEAKLGHVGALHPEPVVGLNAGPFTSIAQFVSGEIANLHGQRPTPTADLNAAPLQTRTDFSLSQLFNLGAQRPTPTALLDSGPFTATTLNALALAGQLAAQRPTPIATMIASTWQAEQALNYVARDRTTYVSVVYTGDSSSTGGIGRVIGQASGGNVGAALASVPRFGFGGSPGGKLRGPGGPRDDLIPAFNEFGQPLRVSNLEWLINAMSSQQYGDRRMGAVNAGTADVRAPGDPGYRAPGVAGPGMSIGQLHVHLEGNWDLTQPQTGRRLAETLQEWLIKLQRENA